MHIRTKEKKTIAVNIQHTIFYRKKLELLERNSAVKDYVLDRILKGHVPCRKTVQNIEKDPQFEVRSKGSDSDSSDSDGDSEIEVPQNDLSYNIVYSVSLSDF